MKNKKQTDRPLETFFSYTKPKLEKTVSIIKDSHLISESNKGGVLNGIADIWKAWTTIEPHIKNTSISQAIRKARFLDNLMAASVQILEHVIEISTQQQNSDDRSFNKGID